MGFDFFFIFLFLATCHRPSRPSSFSYSMHVQLSHRIASYTTTQYFEH